MAAGKGKEVWLIGAFLVIAAVIAVLALSKPSSNTDKPSVDVLSETSVPAQAAPVQAPAAPVQAAVEDKKEEGIINPPHEVKSAPTYAVQVYSFKEKARSEAALKALKEKNYPAYIMVSDLGARGIWYRVRVGTFTKEVDAQAALQSVTRDFKSGIIVTE